MKLQVRRTADDTVHRQDGKSDPNNLQGINRIFASEEVEAIP